MTTAPEIVKGLQTPRYDIFPKNGENLNEAEKAIKLFSHYVSPLDPWQELVIKRWLAKRADGKWASTKCVLSLARQAGKGFLLEARVFYGLLTGETILFTAHEARTSRAMYFRLLQVFEDKRFPEIQSLIKSIKRSNGHESIELTNGGSLTAITRTKNSARGLTCDLIVVDEALVSPDEVMGTLLPVNSSGPRGNPQVIYTSSPPSVEHESEGFTRLRESALSATPDERLTYQEWSPHMGASADFDDPKVWAEAVPSLNIRISEDTVKDERIVMDEGTFLRERMGLWAEESQTQLFPDDIWNSCFDDTVYDLSDMVLGIDIKPDRSSASISVAGIRPDGLHYVELIDSAQGTGWIIPRVLSVVAKQNIKTVVVDSAGPAFSLVEILKGNKIKVYVTTMHEYASSCALFFDAVHNHTLIHRGQPLLNYSIRDATKRKLGEGFAWNRKTTGSDITQLVSCTLALYGVISTKVQKRKSSTSKTKRRVLVL